MSRASLGGCGARTARGLCAGRQTEPAPPLNQGFQVNEQMRVPAPGVLSFANPIYPFDDLNS
jgi:hypothetical protein